MMLMSKNKNKKTLEKFHLTAIIKRTITYTNTKNGKITKYDVPPSLVGERRAYPAPPWREAWVRSPPTPTHNTCLLSAVGDWK